jgi:hypothetical protein
MQVYSEVLFAFRAKALQIAREILRDDFKLIVKERRFEVNKTLYPLSFIVFDENSRLAFFDPNFMEIGLNKRLLYIKDALLRDILRHELLHYYCFILYPKTSSAHGAEFIQLGQKLNLKDEILKASMNEEKADEELVGDLKAERIITKVKKLMELAKSNNTHEAELATMKANQLLLEHQLEFKHLKDDQIFVQRLRIQKRKDAKIMCLYEIIQYFLVKPILHYGKNQVVLEACGSRENLELAQYLVDFLDLELERLYKSEKELGNLHGTRDKNSFFLGVSQGFCERFKQSEKALTPVQSNEIIHIKEELNSSFKAVYHSVGTTQARMRTNLDAKNRGQISGKNLTINAGIKNRTKRSLLGFFK